jgi:hypothetical protein
MNLPPKIFLLTRSYPPFQLTGGAIARRAQVKYLERNGYEVIVVTPNYGNKSVLHSNNIIQTPYVHNDSILSKMERVGIIEDTLSKWASTTFRYLEKIVKQADIVIATSGGELGTYKLATMLKRKIGCGIVFSSHDPIMGSRLDGYRVGFKWHYDRLKYERRYYSAADIIITSSKTHMEALKDKYPELKSKVHNLYFGFVGELSPHEVIEDREYINICYGGAFTPLQRPELLIDIVERAELENHVRIFFIGNYKKYNALKTMPKSKTNITYIEHMEIKKYRAFLQNMIDIGFVSLTEEWLKHCVPSKIFEYIELGLPIYGALPHGDAATIINTNKVGTACHYSDLDGCAKGLKMMVANGPFFEKYRTSKINRSKWSMDETYKEILPLLSELSSKRK